MKFIFMAIVFWVIFGCSTHQKELSYLSKSNIFIKKIPSLKLIKVRKRFDGYKPTVFIDIKNSSDEKIRLEYQCIWSDNSGANVHNSPWQPFIIRGLESRQLNSKSFSDKARKVECTIRNES